MNLCECGGGRRCENVTDGGGWRRFNETWPETRINWAYQWCGKFAGKRRMASSAMQAEWCRSVCHFN